MSRPAGLVQGTLDLLVLKILALEPLNGWAISQRLKQVSGDVLQVSDGSLYPSLHKLEQEGWITRGMAAQREQPPRQVLFTDARRPAAAAERDGFVAAPLRGDLSRRSPSGDVRWRSTAGATCSPSAFDRCFVSSSVQSELDEELQYHIERQIELNVARGMSPAAARHAALRAIGGVEQHKEACRDRRRVRVAEKHVPRYTIRIAASEAKPHLHDDRDRLARARHRRERRHLRVDRHDTAAKPGGRQSSGAGGGARRWPSGIRGLRRRQREGHVSVVGADSRPPDRILRDVCLGRRQVSGRPRRRSTGRERSLGERRLLSGARHPTRTWTPARTWRRSSRMWRRTGSSQPWVLAGAPRWTRVRRWKRPHRPGPAVYRRRCHAGVVHRSGSRTNLRHCTAPLLRGSSGTRESSNGIAGG